VATPRATWRAVFCGFALFIGSFTPLGAAPQQPDAAAPVSLDRIKEELARTRRALKTDVPIPPPRPTFKSRVDQRAFVLTLEEALHRDFDITNEIQRQSANWASQCCGLDIGRLFNAIDRALERRKIRKTREQIMQELALLEAAASKK
jgi:hypothetical protein